MLAVLIAGCDLPGKPRPEDAYIPPDREMRFDTLYRVNCAACHGADGNLGPAPPLNNTLFLDIVPDSVLRNIVGKGRQNTLMPAFSQDQGGQLTEPQVLVLAAGIKARWRLTKGTPGDLPAYEVQQKKTDGDMQKGSAIFARACASCHGADGGGGTYAGKPNGRPIGAINDPAFLALISEQALRRYVITGRPDLEMPSYRENTGRPEGFAPLSAAEIDELAALLASWKRESLARSQ